MYINETLAPNQPRPKEFDKVFTDQAIDFIGKNKDTSPFFVFLSYHSTHVNTPISASNDFLGTSQFGIYGDSVQEMDFHIGRLMNKLDEWSLTNNTLVIFTSDNGSWHLKLRGKKPVTKNNKAGSNGPLRGQKHETWEGGCRTPFVIKAPGLVPAGSTSDEILRMVDLLPTFNALTGAEAPKAKIDGANQLPLLTGQSAQSAVDYHFYYFENQLQAVRDSSYKLVRPRLAFSPWSLNSKTKNIGGQSTPIKTYELYDLKNDLGETTNIANEHPEVVEKLKEQIELMRQDLGDYNIMGTNCRTDVYWTGSRAKLLGAKHPLIDAIK